MRNRPLSAWLTSPRRFLAWLFSPSIPADTDLERRPSAAEATGVAAFLVDVFTRFPFNPVARKWLRENIRFEIGNLNSSTGGGFWHPEEKRVYLYTAQYEAAIHELAHAWWHTRRLGQEDALIGAVQRAASESDPAYARIAGLARGYIHGLPEQGFPGFLTDRNDWEMYAGLASGCMADIRLLPPYLRPFYVGLFDLLPPDAPWPAAIAPHG
ncbi:MAG: hypothetical protein IT330_17735 [Anaerolineae bacterium]|nr:hypothetical protein [Anaerolineae bacterium]